MTKISASVNANQKALNWDMYLKWAMILLAFIAATTRISNSGAANIKQTGYKRLVKKER